MPRKRWLNDLDDISTYPRIDRFFKKVDKTATCWTWTGSISNRYGVFCIRDSSGSWHNAQAHVLSMLIDGRGPVLDGMDIDHLCENRLCVNPKHLAIVPHAENLRSQGLRTDNATGVRGVRWDKERRKWMAEACFDYKRYNLGRFDCFEDAKNAVSTFWKTRGEYRNTFTIREEDLVA